MIEPEQPGDAMLCQMLALIDECMATTEEAPVTLKIGPSTLLAWAEAVQTYERARFPDEEPTDD